MAKKLTTVIGLLVMTAAAHAQPGPPGPQPVPGPWTVSGDQISYPGLAAIGGVYSNWISATTPVIHQAQGGLIDFPGNLNFAGDYAQISSFDASLTTWATATGTPTSTEAPGINFPVSGTVYQIRYPVQAGDSNASIAQGICAAVTADSALLTALLSFHAADGLGYGPVEDGCENQVAGATFIFDQPWGSWGTVTNPFTTTNTSAVVAVHIVGSNTIAGQQVWFGNAIAVGGLTLNGAYTVTTATDVDHFTITAGSSATSGATGGGPVTVTLGVAGVNSTHTTVTIVGGTLGTGPPTMDGGSFFQALRHYPVGYTQQTGDLGPFFTLQEEIGVGPYQQLAYMDTEAVSPTAWRTAIGNLGSTGIKDRLDIGDGIYGPANGCPGDEGDNTISNCLIYGNTLIGLDNGIFGANTTLLGGVLTAHTATNYNVNISQGSGAINFAFENDAGNANVPALWYASHTEMFDGVTPFLNTDGSGNVSLLHAVNIAAATGGTATKYACGDSSGNIFLQTAAC